MMDKTQIKRTGLIKNIKSNKQFNDYNLFKNKHFDKYSWHIKKVEDFIRNKKEKKVVKQYIELITDFINSLLSGNTKLPTTNTINFEIIDTCNILNYKSFFKELDRYFYDLKATYSYRVDGNIINFSVFLLNMN